MEKMCTFRPKLNQVLQTCAKTGPFMPIKRLCCLKKRSKSTFQRMNVCSKWLSWKCPQWILSVLRPFMKVEMVFECCLSCCIQVLLYHFWSFSDTFCTVFGPLFSGFFQLYSYHLRADCPMFDGGVDTATLSTMCFILGCDFGSILDHLAYECVGVGWEGGADLKRKRELLLGSVQYKTKKSGFDSM